MKIKLDLFGGNIFFFYSQLNIFVVLNNKLDLFRLNYCKFFVLLWL